MSKLAVSTSCIFIAVALYGCGDGAQQKTNAQVSAGPAQPAAIGNKPFLGIPPELQGVEFKMGGNCSLDLIGGKSAAETKEITKAQNVPFQGWAFDDVTKTAPKIVAIQFAGVDGKYHLQGNRVPRADLAKGFNISEQLNAGIETNADLTSLASGRYEILVAQRADNVIKLCHTTRVIEIK